MIRIKDNGQPTSELLQLSAQDFSSLSSVSIPPWSSAISGDHFAQFYESEAFLLNSLKQFVTEGLHRGEGVIVVATDIHRNRLATLLTESGVDLMGAIATGQYLALEAGETMDRLMVDSSPDPALFREIIGDVISRASENRPGLRIFGEMVAILWSQENYGGAIRLEELWNQLQQSNRFVLFCGYPFDGFNGASLTKPFGAVCANHTHIIPSESYSELKPDDRLRTIIDWQQKARALEMEIAQRRDAEELLRGLTKALETQVEDLRRLHEMSINLASSLDIDAVLREVLSSAMAVQQSDLGLLSLWDTNSNTLSVKIQSGFSKDFLNAISSVPSGAGARGASFQRREHVIVEDVTTDPICEPYRDIAAMEGILACHCTPLITRNGMMIGVLSVHFRERHRPTERETRLMDLYARMAADSIETARLHHELQQQLDVREQLLTREQMARAEAENANRMKDEFLATVSHELRTPLNAIIGWTHMIRSGRIDSSMIDRGLETIHRNAKAQAQLVEDILDVSRVITGKLRLNMAMVDLAAVINAAVDSVQLAADSKDIRLAVTLDPSARQTFGDASRLQQVVWNLLSNAIKFTANGGLVDVRLVRNDGSVEISVSDTGQGISAEFLPFIFDRFRQEDGTSTRRHGGLGLGLAIVRHLVELHGGTVHADSAGDGLGTCFTIRIPLPQQAKQPQRREAKVKSLFSSTRAAEKNSTTLPSLEGINVLLVDDDLDTLQILTILIREQRANVHAVASVGEAVEVLQWYRPDVVVSDLAMPNDDGFELIRKLRSNESLVKTPAIALTAYVRIEDRARALSAGYNMFVPKPVEPNELITAVANLVEPQVVTSEII